MLLCPGGLLGSQITGPIVFAPQEEVAGGSLVVLSEMCGRDLEMLQKLPRDLHCQMSRSD